MAASSYAEALRRLLISEGGNDDDPRDPGGRTSRGIIQTEWNRWRLTHPGLPSDVWAAPQSEVVAIYKQWYWDKLRCDDLPPGVDYAIFDYGVNSGISRAAKVLQRLVGVTVDGEIGDQTVAYTRVRDPKVLVSAICDERIKFLRGLSTWGTYGRGWTTRVNGVRATALIMAGKAQDVIPSKPPPVLAGAPPWLVRMNSILGLYEFPGGRDNPAILAMAKACGGQIAKTYKHDAIPWCALTVNYCLISAGFPGDDSLWALDFAKYGRKLTGPAVGAIASQSRAGGGHVYLVVGRTANGLIVARGGNQSDMVCDTTFPASDPTRTYTWPIGYPLPTNPAFVNLPIVTPAPKVHKEIDSLPPVAVPSDAGKGIIPEPRVVGKSLTGAGTGTAVAGVTWHQWLLAHPWEATAIGAVVIVVIGGVVYVIYKGVKDWHAKTIAVRQAAPTPGLVPLAI